MGEIEKELQELSVKYSKRDGTSEIGIDGMTKEFSRLETFGHDE